MEEQIITLLTKEEKPVKTLEIARQVCGPDAQAKSVNPTLYKLEKEKKLIKVANRVDNSSPRWTIAGRDVSKEVEADHSIEIKDVPKTPQEIESRILEILQQAKAEVPTLDISKYVFGKGATRKMINPPLYAMEKKNLVRKIAEENGTNPRWTLVA